MLFHANQSACNHHPNRKFYELPALQQYKWYWRLEPDVEYTCAITYDPFVEMERRNKVYGFTIALWELGNSCPSLFREVADWMDFRGVRPTALWKAAVSASWAPWPLRRLLMSWFAHRDARGDTWSLCHYWSNFEIADMDFFRSAEYQAFFDYLDRKGGFYFERVSFSPPTPHFFSPFLFLTSFFLIMEAFFYKTNTY